MRVFLSSVFGGLEGVRNATAALLRKAGLDVGQMEFFTAESELPLDVCLRELARCDLVVLAIGPRYGSVDPESGLSFTHLEYREAKRRRIAIVPFVIRDGDRAESSPELSRFIQEVRGEYHAPEVSASQLPGETVAAVLARLRMHGEAGRHRFLQSAEDFFRPLLTEGTAFTHAHALVGRESTVSELEEFLRSPELEAGILVGAGGVGKSRILLELAQRAAHSPTAPAIRFVGPAGEWSEEDLRQLPARPVCVVVDDAHHRGDLPQLLHAIRGQNTKARFLLSTRPGGTAAVRAALGGLDTGSSIRVFTEVRALEEADAVQLATRLLGPERGHLAPRLAEVAQGNALLIAVGAWSLAHEGAATPELLVQSPEGFRRYALERLLQDLPPQLEGGVPTRRLLEILAAAAPLNREDQELMGALAAMLRADGSSVARALEELERRGVVLRRGRLLRVMPDVLGDHLLFAAAVSERGEPTGFVEEVRSGLGERVLPMLLRSAGELEWRCRALGKPVDALEAVWSDLMRRLPAMTHYERVRLVEMVTPTAGYLPERAIALADWLRAHPEAPADPELLGLGIEWGRASENVAGLYAAVAEHPAYTPRCATTLGGLALAEPIRAGRDAFRIGPRAALEQLAGYAMYRPFEVQEAVLKCMAGLVAEACERRDAAWIAPVAAAALGRECDYQISRVQTQSANNRPSRKRESPAVTGSGRVGLDR